MRKRPPFFEGPLAPRNSFKKSHPRLQLLVPIHVNKIGRGSAVLSNENGLSIPNKVGEEFGRPSLQGRVTSSVRLK